MDDQAHDELRMLQARAYGPESDIHDDPEALERLQELESATRARDSRTPEAPALPEEPALDAASGDPVDAGPIDGSRPGDEGSVAAEKRPPLSSGVPAGDAETTMREGAASTGAVSTDAVRPDAVPPDAVPARGFFARWSGKSIVVAWVASLAVAILVTATVTGFISRRVQADPREVAVLGADALAEWPGIFGGYTTDGEGEPGVPEGGMAFQAFHGLTLFRMNNGMFAYGLQQTCLLVVDTSRINAASNSYDGPIFNGCAAGEFPATAELVVEQGPQNLPDELLEAFPEGTALQFVLDGDEVVVLSDRG